MRIFIYSTQCEIGQIINDHLSSIGNTCFLFATEKQLAEGLKTLGVYPDLLILDYTMYNHELFNIRNYFKELSINIPVIFYNDPCLTSASRKNHWLSQITILYKIDKQTKLPEYQFLFKNLEELIESEELSPYIKLMQKPLSIPNILKKQSFNLTLIREKFNENINTFRENVSLPNNLYYLLSIFHKNDTRPLTLNDIRNSYKSDNKSITESSLKVLISNLRKQIEKDPSCKFRIHNKRGLYKLEKIDNV